MELRIFGNQNCILKYDHGHPVATWKMFDICIRKPDEQCALSFNSGELQLYKKG